MTTIMCPACRNRKPIMWTFKDRYGITVCKDCYMERTKLDKDHDGNTMPLRSK